MLKINVSNFRGIRHAALECSRIALLCGTNEQGKSSIIDAVRALLDGTQAPYGLTKEELGTKLVFSGADTAMVELTNDEGRAMSVSWPSAEVATSGMPFRATKLATGTLRFTAMSERDRNGTLAQYLKTDPTQVEFMEAVEPLELPQEVIDEAWTDTVKLGWDAAWQKHKTNATKLKGAWEAITGASYGIKVGGNWRPKGWGPDHEAITDDELKQDLAQATTDLEAAIGTVAITDSERKKYEGLVRGIPKLEEMLKTREQDGKRAAQTKDAAEKAFLAIPVIEPENWPACPHCKKEIAVRAAKGGGTLLEIPKKKLDPAERKKLQDQSEAAELNAKTAQQAYYDAQTAYKTVKDDLQVAVDAKAHLEKSGTESNATVNLDELRGEVTRVRSIQDAKQKIINAVKKHIEVIARLSLAETLAPEGLRGKKLGAKLDEFNDRLAVLCATADWAEVRIIPDLDVELDGIRYDLCARSGQMRCDVTLQAAFAVLDGSEMLLVDDADMLDAKGRNGLFALLGETERYGIVGMMLTKIAQTPDLDAAEMGASYWVDDAVAHPLADYKKRAA